MRLTEQQALAATSTPLYPRLSEFVAARVAEFDQIPADRAESLRRLAEHVRARRTAGQLTKLIFVCTHNSRRSQMAQSWAAAAAAHFGAEGVQTFSGGVEQTAFNPRAVSALQRAGFQIGQIGADEPGAKNPQYRVSFAAKTEPLVCFSKAYDERPNPDADFCAVMVCSDSDEKCPTVKGAVMRLALPYDDPKAADGANDEAQTYDERCAQIAREMLYMISQAK